MARESRAYGFVAYGGPGQQRFLTVSVPEPGPGQVLVAVHAAGVNPVDWKVRAGRHRNFLPLSLPAVLGREVAGTVAAVGPDVTSHSIGDRVFGSTVGGCGGYAEWALVPENRAARVPDGLSFTDAAALPIAAGTAHDGLAVLDLRPGQALLILGCGGGVGTVAAQLAVHRGVTVLGTASAAKRGFLSSLGAVPLAYDEDDLVGRLTALAPTGPEAVLDLVGDGALTAVSGALRGRCRILSVEEPTTTARFGARPLTRVGDTATLGRLAALVVDGALDPHVHHIVPFAHASEALAAVEAGHARGKVVVEVRQSG
jgi:NADPH:quinone reductase-like Zn-dependent oxidoreductase